MQPGRRLILSLFVLASPTMARAACRKSAVLFVCPAGTVKSAIAREALRRRASAAGLPVEVWSRAISPADHVSPVLARRLAADGLSPAAGPVLAVKPADVSRADIVIAFDAAAEHPILRGARGWSTPSWNADYDRARADLDARLATLVAELAGACP